MDQTDAPKQSEIFAAWLKYEDVAMHFNELLIRFRVQVLGGMATLTAIGGSVLGPKLTRGEGGHEVLVVCSAVLLSAWLGAAVLDLGYYSLLLRGAVEALLDIESRMPFKLSTTIEQHARQGVRYGRWFYIIVAVPLAAILAWSVCGVL